MFGTTITAGANRSARTTRTTRSTRKAPKALAAAAVLTATAVTGVVATAGPANASTVQNKPWKHTVTVESTNVQVHQHNWIRADIDRTDGYQSRSYTYTTGYGGINRYTPFAESTGGVINARTSDQLVDGTQSNTSRYDGSVFLAVEVFMTTQGPSAVWPGQFPDNNINLMYLGPNASTGWHHLEVVGAGGDFVKMDYRVTNNATPQY